MIIVIKVDALCVCMDIYLILTSVSLALFSRISAESAFNLNLFERYRIYIYVSQ